LREKIVNFIKKSLKHKMYGASTISIFTWVVNTASHVRKSFSKLLKILKGSKDSCEGHGEEGKDVNGDGSASVSLVAEVAVAVAGSNPGAVDAADDSVRRRTVEVRPGGNW